MAMVTFGWQCPYCLIVWAPSVQSCKCQQASGGYLKMPEQNQSPAIDPWRAKYGLGQNLAADDVARAKGTD